MQVSPETGLTVCCTVFLEAVSSPKTVETEAAPMRELRTSAGSRFRSGARVDDRRTYARAVFRSCSPPSPAASTRDLLLSSFTSTGPYSPAPALMSRRAFSPWPVAFPYARQARPRPPGDDCSAMQLATDASMHIAGSRAHRSRSNRVHLPTQVDSTTPGPASGATCARGVRWRLCLSGRRGVASSRGRVRRECDRVGPTAAT